MAFIIKSSKLFSRFIGLGYRANLTNSPLDVLNSKNVIAINEILKNKYATAATKVMTVDMLEKSIHQLDLDARYKQNIYKQDVEEILNAVRKWGCITYPQTLLLLKCCNRLTILQKPEERIKLSEKVWNLFNELGINLDIFHYNSLLNVYLENGHVFSPQEFLSVLSKHRIEPNPITYQKLLKAYCQQGDITGASNLLEIMKEKDFSINEDIFNSLIHGHCQVNDFESANSILDLMKQKGINPSSETYVCLICGYAQKGNIEEVRRLIKEAEEKDVILLDKDYLEIVYTLAVNGYNEHTDEFLEKIKRGYGYVSHAPIYICRLLYKNLDSVAMKIYETMEPGARENKDKNYGKFIIEYFVKNRSADELLELCKSLEEKGYVWAPYSVALRSTLEEEDSDKAVALLSAMNDRDIPLRSHYFWPLIIDSSKIGNAEILKILKHMKRMNVSRCFLTMKKIIFPYYDFGGNWMSELEKLKTHGVDIRISSRFLLNNFLKKKNLRDAEMLASKKPVKVTNSDVTELVKCIVHYKGEEESAIGILYSLLHDLNLDTEETTDNSENAEILLENTERFIAGFIKELVSGCEGQTSTVLNVLKNMLNKKIPIPTEAAELLTRKFENEEINSLVEKLTSPDVQLELDKELLALKKRKFKPEVRQLLKYSISNDLVNGEKLWKTLGEKATISDAISMMILYLKNNDITSAMNICENLRDRVRDPEEEIHSRHYRNFMASLSSVGEVKDVEKAFEIGIEMNFIEPKEYSYLIRCHLARGDLDSAVNVFCEKCLENNRESGYSLLVEKLIKAQHAEGLQKVTDALAQVRNENLSLSRLMFHFAQFGQSKQTRKLLETPKFVLRERDFDFGCKMLYLRKSTEGFENFLEATKGVDGIDRSTIFKYLLQLYLDKENFQKVKELWLQCQQENVLIDAEFIGKITPALKKVGEPVPTNSKELFSQKKPKDTTRNEEEVERKSKRNQKMTKLKEEIFNLAVANNWDEVKNVLKEEKFNLRGVCLNLVKAGKISEYLTLIKTAAKVNMLSVTRTILFNILIPDLEKDVNLIEECKQTALELFSTSNGKFKRPVIDYWLICLTVPGRVNEAEDIYEKYLKELVNVDRCLIAWCQKTKNPDTIRRVLESQKMRPSIEGNMADCFGTLIDTYTSMADLDAATSCLNQAVESNVAESLKAETLLTLNKELKAVGKAFPHPHLLEKL